LSAGTVNGRGVQGRPWGSATAASAASSTRGDDDDVTVPGRLDDVEEAREDGMHAPREGRSELDPLPERRAQPDDAENRRRISSRRLKNSQAAG
jgi:hypothetical protein